MSLFNKERAFDFAWSHSERTRKLILLTRRKEEGVFSLCSVFRRATGSSFSLSHSRTARKKEPGDGERKERREGRQELAFRPPLLFSELLGFPSLISFFSLLLFLVVCPFMLVGLFLSFLFAERRMEALTKLSKKAGQREKRSSPRLMSKNMKLAT